MLQQTRDSACHCCLIVKYLSQLHKQFISPIPLVQFNWYCERGGDNDEALTCTIACGAAGPRIAYSPRFKGSARRLHALGS